MTYQSLTVYLLTVAYTEFFKCWVLQLGRLVKHCKSSILFFGIGVYENEGSVVIAKLMSKRHTLLNLGVSKPTTSRNPSRILYIDFFTHNHTYVDIFYYKYIYFVWKTEYSFMKLGFFMIEYYFDR